VHAHIAHAHIGVAGEWCAGESPRLPLACYLHSLPDDLSRLARARVGEFVVVHPRNIQMDIYAVEQRAADLVLIAADERWTARARLERVAIPTTRAGVHGSHQHEVGGEGESSRGAADREQF